MNEQVAITSKLGADQRVALEQVLFFNANQHRVRNAIVHSIQTYGVPEIYEEGGNLRIRVGDIQGVQSLFAVSAQGRPVGAAVFVRAAHERFVVLHLVVAPRDGLGEENNTPVLLKLMHGIRTAARRTRGVDRIELVYKGHNAMRLHGAVRLEG